MHRYNVVTLEVTICSCEECKKNYPWIFKPLPDSKEKVREKLTQESQEMGLYEEITPLPRDSSNNSSSAASQPSAGTLLNNISND